MSNTNTKKTVLKTIFFTLLIEFILAIILGFILYKNYKKISVAQSGIAKVSELKNIRVKEVNINSLLTNKGDESINDNKDNNYNGILGKIEIINKSNIENYDNNIINYNYEKKINIDLNKNNIKIFSILQALNENNILDKYIYSNILKKHLEKISDKNIKQKKEKENNINDNNEINNTLNRILKFAVILEKIDTNTANKIKRQINEKITDNFSKITQKITSKKIKELNSLLKNIENIENIPDNIYGKTKIIDNQKFQYIINKLLSDDYYKNIKEASRKTGIDKKLILSAIAVEQLRYLNSNRAFAKKLLKQNKFLTNFSKFSYGLGGIKVPTFIKINQWLKKYEPYIYNKYFLYYDNLTKKSNEEIATLKEIGQWNENNKEQIYNEDKIIELLKKHDISTLYTAGLLLSIMDKRKYYGIDISDKPGIILTLYNMGNIKTPHKNPGIGGALIPVLKDKKKYFGEVGYMFYNYLDFYLDLK